MPNRIDSSAPDQISPNQAAPEPKISRRVFLSAAAGAALLGTGCSGFPTIVPRHVLGGRNFVPPSEKVRLVGIGLGGRGLPDFHGLTANDIAYGICDVDHNAVNTALNGIGDFKPLTGCKPFYDYREMLETEAASYDAVLIATPDHHHAPAALHAIKLGKHVFVEKPLCHNIYEAQIMQDAARKSGVVAVMGIQGHASADARTIVEWVAQGAIGNPTEVLMWTDRPLWEAGLPAPTDGPPVPGFYDWDKWLGPAADRPYNPIYHANWRGWCDFGAGALGDIGCHTMDASFWALGLTEPERIEVECPPCNGASFPAWSILTYHFPAIRGRGPIKVTWYDGKKQPPNPPELTAEGRKIPDNGQIIIGDEGKIMAGMYGDGPRLIPEKAMQAWAGRKLKPYLERVPGTHYEQFLAACRGQQQDHLADFDYAAPLTRMVLTGNLAVMTGQSIEWDARRRKVTNHPEANRYLTRAYRPGWEV